MANMWQVIVCTKENPVRLHNIYICIYIYCFVLWLSFDSARFSTRYWPFVRGNHRSPVNSPHKGQWRVVLMFSLICARRNAYVNNRDAGDLRIYRAHYDVTVMSHVSSLGSLDQIKHTLAMKKFHVINDHRLQRITQTYHTVVYTV